MMSSSSCFSVFFLTLLLILPSSSWALLRPNRHVLASNDTVLSSINSNFNNQFDYLTSDDEARSIGTQHGNDVHIASRGDIEAILDDDLTFEICTQTCNLAEVRVSFDGTPAPGSSNPCSFIAGVDQSDIWFMESTNGFNKVKVPGCGKALIQKPLNKFIMNGNDNLLRTTPGCAPSIGMDRIVKLNVQTASSSCVLILKNAKIKPPASSFSTTTASEVPSRITTSTASTEESGMPIYGWILIGVFVFLIFIGLCILVIWLVMKEKSKKHGPPEGEYKAVAMGTKKVVIEMPESPKKKIQKKASVENNNGEHEEPMKPTVESKIEQVKEAAPVKKTMEKEEQIKAQHPEPSAEKIAPVIVVKAKKIKVPKNPHVPYPMVFRSEYNKAKSLKSGTHSVSDKMVLNKEALMESHVDSLSRHECLDKVSYAEAAQMRKNYPIVKGRKVQESEVNLFLISISEMYAELNRMIAEAEKVLVECGVQFDDKKQITKMTEMAREYLRQRSTPEIHVYFAFGAEYSQHITSDLDMIHKFSLPLLMVVALMPRFPEFNRRKACTWIRRQAPTIRKECPLRERTSKPFPIHILERAYFKSIKDFTNIDSLDTDSTSGEKQPSNQSLPSNQSTVIDAKKIPAEDVTQESKTKKKIKNKK